MNKPRMQAWKVYDGKRRGESKPDFTRYMKHIDTVYFTDECTEDYVRDSLINHDGYPHSIVVEVA